MRNIEKILGGKVLETFKGGKTRGGGARSTKLGASVLDQYEQSERHLTEIL